MADSIQGRLTNTRRFPFQAGSGPKQKPKRAKHRSRPHRSQQRPAIRAGARPALPRCRNSARATVPHHQQGEPDARNPEERFEKTNRSRRGKGRHRLRRRQHPAGHRHRQTRQNYAGGQAGRPVAQHTARQQRRLQSAAPTAHAADPVETAKRSGPPAGRTAHLPCRLSAQLPETSAHLRGTSAQLRPSCARLCGKPAHLPQLSGQLRGTLAHLRASSAHLRGKSAQLPETSAQLRGKSAQQAENGASLRKQDTYVIFQPPNRL